MSIKDRYTSGTQDNPRWGAILRNGIILTDISARAEQRVGSKQRGARIAAN
jgi:hypothetical protein